MIQQASLTGVLRTILTLIAIYYIAKFVMRLAAPYLMKYAAKKMEQKMKDQFGNMQNQQRPSQPNTTKSELPKEKKKVGDYIEFEEIDE